MRQWCARGRAKRSSPLTTDTRSSAQAIPTAPWANPEEGRPGVTVWQTAGNAKVDPPGEERFKQAEVRGDFVRTLVTEQHARGTDAQVGRQSSEQWQQDFGAGVRY